MSSQIQRILITPGEPAGIGPDLIAAIAQLKWQHELVVIADPEMLITRANQLSCPLQLITCDLNATPSQNPQGTLKIIPVSLKEKANAGELNRANASYVLETLKLAAQLCQTGKANAVVTGPVNKEIINEAGVPFTGHTEFFAEESGVSQTVMLFVVNDMKVALLTTHLPLAEVPKAVTANRLESVLSILNDGLKQQFDIQEPHIFVCGLNPHAGEGGYLGREEIEIINPALLKLREKGMHLTGALPADTIFTPPYLAKADAILAMYHDQGLPIVKYQGFGNAVNVTLGLPFIRTSVDHGTAIDLAGTGLADSGSLKAAIELAITLSQSTN